jgi:preprotein translocase subunit SecF
VLGYSVNDTIVVFDRLRENLPKSDNTFEETVNISVNQTLVRSINTSFTTLLVLLSVLFFGGASIQSFVLALSVGIFVGTYSSIFVASPILVIWEKYNS